MTNQSASPANAGSASSLQAGDILYPMRAMLFITLLCMGYSLSRPSSAKGKKRDLLLPATISPSDPEWAGLPPWQRKASEKAVERYAEVQEKKWRRWNEAMFER